MKVVILAGGHGSRLSEHTTLRPKPMVEIGEHPILWHIMKIYAAHGFDDFVIACGYKGEVIKEYFHGFYLRNTDFTVRLKDGAVTTRKSDTPSWTVTLVDTGLSTMTGGRLRRLAKTLGDETVMVTYGDGVGNIDLTALLAFHRSHGKLATVTAVRPPSRFGGLKLDGGRVLEFAEKPQTGEAWINGGFFVFERAVLDRLDSDDCVLEGAPLERLARDGELMAFEHSGFWQPMDTLREKRQLEELWASGKAPWKVW
jgi:glucose-1-phosphate cytidylyltransferase